MGIRDWLARQGKASIIGLQASEQPDKPLERAFDDTNLLSTYRDDAWVYILTNKVASQASQAPLQIGTLDADQTFTATPNHPVQALLDAPNPQMDGGELIHLLMIYMEITGHAPIEVVKSRGGKPAELWLHNPGPWRIVARRDASIMGYLYLMESAQDLRWRPDQMTYLRWPDPNNRWYGQGRIAAVRQEVMTEEYAAIRAKQFEKNMGVPPGILSSEMPLGEPTAKELQKRWQEAVGGYRNAGKIAVLGSKTTYQAVSLNARDAEWLAQRRWNVDTLAGALEVPIPLIRMEGSTFSNMQQARAELWEGNIQPKLNRIARMATARLLPLLGVEGHVLRFDYSKIEALGENDLEAAQTAKAWADSGTVTVDEVRARLSLPPHPDAKVGERTLVPSSLTLKSVEDITAPPEPPVLPAAAAPKPPPAKSKAQRPDRELVLAPVRSAYARDLSAFFKAQHAALVPLVGKTGASDPQRGELKDTPDIIERVIAVLHATRFSERLRRISRDPIAAALQLGGLDAASIIGIEFDIEANESAIARLTTHLNLLDAQITGTTVGDVRGILEGALRNQLSNAEIRAELDRLFEGYEEWRLDRITRTELTNAYNLGAVDKYRDAGIQLVRVVDGDLDGPCAQANGAVWTLDEAEGNPSSHPNCTRSFIPDTSALGRATQPAIAKAQPINVTVAPPAITVNLAPDPGAKMRTVIDYAPDGTVRSWHEEPILDA